MIIIWSLQCACSYLLFTAHYFHSHDSGRFVKPRRHRLDISGYGVRRIVLNSNLVADIYKCDRVCVFRGREAMIHTVKDGHGLLQQSGAAIQIHTLVIPGLSIIFGIKMVQ